MKTPKEILEELPPERQKRIKAIAESFNMELGEAIREEAMAEWIKEDRQSSQER